MDLLRRHNPRGLVLLSGDVHHAELLQYTFPSPSPPSAGTTGDMSGERTTTAAGNRANTDDSQSHSADSSSSSGSATHVSASSRHSTDAVDSRPLGTLHEVTSSGLTHTCADNFITKHLGLCPLLLRTFHAHRKPVRVTLDTHCSSDRTIDSSNAGVDTSDSGSRTCSSDSSRQQQHAVEQSEDFFIGRNYGVISLQPAAVTAVSAGAGSETMLDESTSLTGTTAESKSASCEHVLNVSVYSMDTHRAVLSLLVSPLSTLTAPTHTHCDFTSSSRNDTSRADCLSCSNTTTSTNESLYFETFYKLSPELAVNVWITLLALVMAGVYVITRCIKQMMRRFKD